VNAKVTQYTSSVNVLSLPTDMSHGIVTVHGCAESSPVNDCQVRSRRRDRLFEIFKMDGCCPDSPRTSRVQHIKLKCATLSNDSSIHENVSN